MGKQIVGSMSEWSGVLKDLFRQIDDGSIGLSEVQALLEHQGCLPNVDWHKVYEVLSMSAEYVKDIRAFGPITEDPNLWVMPVIKGATCNKVVAAIRELKVDAYTYASDLDKGVPTNDRDPNNGSYAIGVRRTVEADEENKNLSANQLKSSHKGITLLERLLLELGYFLTTGKHLDVKNVTLCSGSRNSGGNVPGVGWGSDGRRVYVDWYHSDSSGGDLRSRSVVFS